jgi:ATP/maltotriose-dependent transcriptional regulator MalT
VDDIFSLAGRQAEWGKLAGVLRRFSTGSAGPWLVEVTGDAGIGKTALLYQFAKASHATGASLAAAWGGKTLNRTPLGMFSAAVHGHERLLSHPRTHYWTVRERLEELASPSLVLVLDDLHSADEHSLDLLGSLLRQPPKAQVMFVLGYRDRQADAKLRAAIEGWSPHLPTTRIRLGPLSEWDADAILAGQGITSWRRELYEDSWGNPAYLKVLAAERGVLSTQPGPQGFDRSTAAGHYAAFQGELARLTPESRDAAEAAAVVGCEFDAEMVSKILDQPEAVTLCAIGELIGQDIIRLAERGLYFTFRHPTVHRAVYHGSRLGTRVELHVRADAILKERGASAAERAPHVAQSARYGDLTTVGILEEAAREVVLSDPSTAVTWLRSALRALPNQPQFSERRVRILVRLAKASGAAGNLRECREIMHEVLRALPERLTAERAKAVAFTAMVQRLLGDDAQTGAMLRAELDGLGACGPEACALAFEIAARELGAGNWTSSTQWAQDALRFAERDENQTQRLACHGLLGKAMACAGDLELAARHLELGTAILDQTLDGDFGFRLDAVVWIGWCALLLGRLDEAVRHFGKAVDFASRSGRLLVLPHLLAGQTFALYSKGQLARARVAAEHAVHLARRSDSDEQLARAYSMLALTDTATGRPESGANYAGLAAGLLQGSVGSPDTLALRMLGETWLMTGNPEECLSLADMAGGPGLPAVDACSRVAWYELFTRAELAAGRAKAAITWAERAVTEAGRLGEPGQRALARLADALARLADAQARLVEDPGSALLSAMEAADGLAAAGLPLHALRARAVIGVALWHRGCHQDAARELKTAQLAAEQADAVALARIIRTERRRLAARFSRATAAETEGGVTVLTGRERQIADLVATGMTNRLISRRLGISQKTVEMHLTNVFAKLEVSNRAALAVLVARKRPEVDREMPALAGVRCRP